MLETVSTGLIAVSGFALENFLSSAFNNRLINPTTDSSAPRCAFP
jgi:hypothetical protein